MDTIKIQVRFTEKTPYGEYSDCLYYDVLPEQKEIDIAKKERVDNWITVITTPQPEIEVTEEMLQKQIMEIEEQEAVLESQKVDLQNKIAEIKLKGK
jgi:hypothetical protein